MIEDMKHLIEEEGRLDMLVRVRPHAVQSRIITQMEDGSVKIDIAASAEGGKGNMELIRYLSEVLEVPKTKVTILSGATARLKLVRISK